MPQLGYALSSEEHGPLELVRNAARAEQAGFEFALISDHFHPWTDRQGESPFVWSVIGGIAQATERLRLGTGVTRPTVRTHPAIVARALGPATSPPPRGRHYEVANARLYTTPDAPPDVIVAAGGEASAELAGRIGDGLVVTSPDEDTISKFAEGGGDGKPRIGQCHVCWAETEEEGLRTALEWFPNIALGGELTQELPQPAHFEQAAELLSEDDIADIAACGPDPERHVEMIQRFVDAGCDHVYLHQIGPDQDGFFDFYEREVLPRFSSA